jgi:NAD(P)-dependent dehydrogenase (short-subunit alcohol dehydrogenase family)
VQLELKGKSVLVTGSSRGIGRSIGEAFLKEGASVAFNGRNNADLKSTVTSQNCINAIAIAGDVSKQEQANSVVQLTLEAFGKLDILICNVGNGQSVPPGLETENEWKRVFENNLWSSTNMVEASKSALSKTKGVIVLISSICGQEVVNGAPLTYSAAKAALNSYVRGIARPLGANEIRINAIAPGNILFNGSIWQKKIMEDEASVKKMLDRQIALKKFGSPEDIANLTLFISSKLASYITGSIFVVDGGQVHN